VADDLAKSLDLPADLITAIYNPMVDEELEALSQEEVDHPWLGGEVPVLLAVGRLVSQKDYPMLLRAFSEVRRKRPVRLIVLGEGELRGELEHLAKRLRIQSDVDFPGFIKNPFPFMRKCTMYVLTSRIEGLPGALIQAMACGAPAISTDCPSGPSEIIQQGKNGILVPVGDSAKLVSAIETLLDTPHLRETLSKAGRDIAVAFGVSPMIRRYEDAISTD
jgi:glycosyltransferase involved in cell wall biosynthesis